MLTSLIILAIIGALGAFDIFYFHRRARLTTRRQSRVEATIHVLRGAVYALQFGLIPNLAFTGRWYGALIALLVADVALAIADVLVEPASRKELGGLPGGEYVMHVVLSALAGAYLHGLIAATLPWGALPTALTWGDAGVPEPLRWILGVMAVGCALVTLLELLELLDGVRPRPRPLHVAVRLRCTVAELWARTQDHVLHPTWDHRFSRIIMLEDEIRTGTLMRYERDILGLTVRGHGRYKLHRPLRQSTFEFWSDDPRSLIRRGVGLWRYVEVGDGKVELRTSYTYQVRWGVLGRWIDRLVFRPLLQRETERSFARLTRRWFADGASPVVGRRGGKPALVPA